MKKSPNTNAINAPEKRYLYVAISQLQNAGKGLFTAIDIYKDEVIATFKGEMLTNIQATNRAKKGNDQYFIAMLDGSIMDSLNSKCFAKYANDAMGLTPAVFKNNSRIALDENDQVCIIATKKIKAGEEVFCGYGKRYWKKYQNP
ncbi:MAG: SET domain-containing protein-lysine N-methyltransferase [Bacteroidia bacterium]|nr:SET domain-containing protein-lysine N-methyltransferase [Bacteroidia bacterium]MBP9689092.1 SET domain-containing protein-lysine N-methyltransferase [Bacteroidia bacterium]